MAELGLDFDNVSILQFRLERHDSSVDLGSDTGIANLRMNCIGKVYGRGIPWQNDDFAFGCESINFLRIKIDFQSAQKVARILHFLLPFHQMPQPEKALIIFFVQTSTRFVLPMSCDSFFSNSMHLHSSDLNLKRLAVRANY